MPLEHFHCAVRYEPGASPAELLLGILNPRTFCSFSKVFRVKGFESWHLYPYPYSTTDLLSTLTFQQSSPGSLRALSCNFERTANRVGHGLPFGN